MSDYAIGITGITLLFIGISSFVYAMSSMARSARSIAGTSKLILNAIQKNSRQATEDELYKIFTELHNMSDMYQTEYSRQLMSLTPDEKKMDEAATKSSAVEACIRVIQKYVKNKPAE